MTAVTGAAAATTAAAPATTRRRWTAMRISELSARSGVPIPRIKYYIREGLVPRAQATADDPGGYGDVHLHRVRLIRAMVTIGGMSIASARVVLTELDSPAPQVPVVLGQAMLGINARPDDAPSENRARAARVVDDLVAARGWNLAEDEPARDALITAVETMLDTGHADLLGHLEVYAEAADRIADADMASVAATDSAAAIVEKAVLGTVLGEIFIGSLRRLAHSDRARRRFWPGEGDDAEQ
ncbi:MerR family transcriptional regulator [Brevibacterium casei]|uniref:MerR family transcriptional regulator n=1 Tax=Brevibacterium casei TaxID=33889 RepID=UPI0034510055